MYSHVVSVCGDVPPIHNLGKHGRGSEGLVEDEVEESRGEDRALGHTFPRIDVGLTDLHDLILVKLHDQVHDGCIIFSLLSGNEALPELRSAHTVVCLLEVDKECVLPC